MVTKVKVLSLLLIVLVYSLSRFKFSSLRHFGKGVVVNIIDKNIKTKTSFIFPAFSSLISAAILEKKGRCFVRIHNNIKTTALFSYFNFIQFVKEFDV